ncbi:hypothetical protein [Loktanella sp. S4079]|uniref:hypothetical protein n=1 Tax=Loktanella sp. S4079 TaxID=579483 RepID=UPI0005F9B09B|nr:hypothetical protein [Loktanella sp. S4079]KJZ20381.1 hypothetical protein TW80_06150 [Loktanella sp. S4079]
MIVIQSLGLSFRIFIRLLFILPLLAVLYITLQFLLFGVTIALLGPSLFVSLLAMLCSTVIGVLVSWFITMHPFFVGVKIGLRCLDVPVKKERAIKTVIGYGFVDWLAISGVAFIVITGTLALAGDLAHLGLPQDKDRVLDPTAAFADLIYRRDIAIPTILIGLSVLLIRSALLPAIASFLTADQVGKVRLSNFDGFGAKLPTMIALSVLSCVIPLGVMPIVGEAQEYLGFINVFTETFEATHNLVLGRDIEASVNTFIYIAIAVLISVWAFSLQCAGAAVIQKARIAESGNNLMQGQGADVDVGELMRSRMPGRGGS